MRLVTIKGFENIFEDDNFQLEHFLNSVPKELAIKICCLMSSNIYLKQDSKKSQFDLLNFFLRRQESIVRNNIFRSVFDFKEKEINIFKQVYINEFLLYCLIHCKTFEYDDTKIENDLMIFKAYLKVVENFNNKHQINEECSKEEYFEVNIWPLLVTQIKENIEIYPFTPYLKSILFFHFIKGKTDARESLDNYFNALKQNPLDFTNYLMGIISRAIKGDNTFVLKVDEIGAIFFDKFTFDKVEFEKTKDKNSYLMINPLFKVADKEYLIFNYNYLCNKLFTGFFHDFHDSLKEKHKTINGYKIESKNDFRSFVGEHFTEKYLFRKMLQIIFKEKYYKIIFNDQKIDSFPDAIVLYKNELIIFEIKDASVPSDIFTNRNYFEIKKMIENKYGNDNKGTGQIVKFLTKLSNHKYSNFFNTEGLEINLNKLRIYPVIIYTENTFDCAGFMNFLNDTFKNQINLEFKNKPFKYISRLNFINLDFIIDHLDILSDNKSSLLKVIKEVSKESHKRENKLKGHYIEGALENYNVNFESYFHFLFKFERSKNYIEFINKELDLIKIFKEISSNNLAKDQT